MTYACPYCSKNCSNDTELHRHSMNSHAKCIHCEYTSSIEAIRKHASSHHRDLYPCSVSGCERGFFLEYSLAQHMESNSHGPWKVKRKRKRNKSKPRHTERVVAVDVYPDSKTFRECGELIDRMINFLQHNTNLEVGKVVKGGSLGKGTSIKTKSDIDLAVFLDDCPDVETLRSRMPTIQENIRHHMSTDSFANEIKFTRTTRHCVQYTLQTRPGEERHDIDILPAVDVINKASGSLESVYQEMKGKSEGLRQYYSVCLTSVQVEFVKSVPAQVKDLIRIVKDWKAREDLHELKSYCVELIVIKWWEKKGKPESLDLTMGKRDILRDISNLSTNQITWPDRYDMSKYGGIPNDDVIIMDPANPYTNTAARIADPKAIEKAARTALNKM